MWFKKIKRKKLQYLLIALILIFSSTIISACLSFFAEISLFSEEYYSRENFMDTYIIGMPYISAEKLEKHNIETDDFEKFYSMPSKLIDLKIKVNHHSLTHLRISVLTFDDINQIPIAFDVVEGDKKNKSPVQGEVWISNSACDANNIKLGDTISLNNEKLKLKVSGIISSALYPNGTIGIGHNFYINKLDFESLEGQELRDIFVSMNHSRFDETKANDYIKSILGEDGFDVAQNTLNSAPFKMAITTSASMLGGIGLVAAFLIFVISLVIIQAVIQANIMQEYKSIGVYKAQGFSHRKIRGIYTASFSFVGYIAILIGLFLGLPLSKWICVLNLKYLLGFSLSSVTVTTTLISGILLMLTITSSAYHATRSIKKISPVIALQSGTTSTKRKLKKSLIKNAGSSFTIVVNEIFKHKKINFLTTFILTLSFFICFMFSGIYTSISQISEYKNIWFTVVNGDAYITGSINQELSDYLKENDKVKEFGSGSLSTGTVTFDKEKYGTRIDFISPTAALTFSKYNASLFGIRYALGKGPDNTNEVAVSDKILDNSNLQVGDYIDLTINKQTKTFLIVGSYQALMNDRNSIQFVPEALKEMNENYTDTFISCFLKDGTSLDLFKSEIEENFQNVKVEEDFTLMDEATKSVKDMMLPASIVMILCFILFAVLNIVNCIILDQASSRRSNGIIKALGFTNGYIMRKNLIKMSLLSILGIVLGLGLEKLLSRKMIIAMLGIDVYITNASLLLFIAVVTMVFIILVTLLCNTVIRNISPTELMDE